MGKPPPFSHSISKAIIDINYSAIRKSKGDFMSSAADLLPDRVFMLIRQPLKQPHC